MSVCHQGQGGVLAFRKVEGHCCGPLWLCCISCSGLLNEKTCALTAGVHSSVVLLPSRPPMSDKATVVASLNILGRLSVLHHIGTKHNFCCEKPDQFPIMT